jgi:hypothetical protein
MSSTNSVWLHDEFKAVRDDFLKNVKNPGKHDFMKLTTAKDMWDATDEMQKEQTKTKTLRGLNRIRPFLVALGQFSSTIEVFVQAKPDILALIWVRPQSTILFVTLLRCAQGPVNFHLQVPSSLSSVLGRWLKC